MPGLVNAHTHLYQVLLRAVWEDMPFLAWLKRIYGVAEALNPEHVRAGTLLGCLENLKGGVTTVCEHNFLNPGRRVRRRRGGTPISESGPAGAYSPAPSWTPGRSCRTAPRRPRRRPSTGSRT